MKKKRKSYVVTFEKPLTENGKDVFATILIYGELWEDGVVDGIRLQHVGLSRDGSAVLEVKSETVGALSAPYARTKIFNMGWAICSPDDKFDESTGIEIAKRRFAKYPITTRSGNFLTDDMIHSIMENEYRFISSHFNNFYKKGPDTAEEKPLTFENDDFISFDDGEEKDGEFLWVARVNKDLGDKVHVYWEIKARRKDGTFSKEINTGNEIYVPKNGFRLATKDELERVNKLCWQGIRTIS